MVLVWISGGRVNGLGSKVLALWAGMDQDTVWNTVGVDVTYHTILNRRRQHIKNSQTRAMVSA